ncbi:MAG: DNA polymerase III subunit beta [Candidatus Pacebacteria bacterium]|nr:DNA polymerase III subunit beta [Candidatus Paceibacterota bacterium]
MKAEILKDLFKKALTASEKITRKASSLPALQNVLINAEGSFLELTTTNLETTVRWWILAKIGKKGHVAVPATFLANVVSLIPVEKLELQEENQNLIITTPDQKVQIQGQDPSEFPIIPKVSKNDSWKIDTLKLSQGLSQVVDVPSVSQIRPEISGIYLFVKAGLLKIVATDSFRLAEKTIKLSQESPREYSFIMPQAAAREVISIFSQESGDITVYCNPNQVLFETANQDASQPQINIMSRLIDGEYPNYQEIIPKKFVSRLVVNKEELVSQIKKAGLFSGRTAEVQFSVLPKEGKLKLFSQSVEAGKNEAVLPCKTEGEAINVSFNHKFLLDGLNNIKSSEVELELSENDGPGVLKPVGDNSFIYILMPVKQ